MKNIHPTFVFVFFISLVFCSEDEKYTFAWYNANWDSATAEVNIGEKLIYRNSYETSFTIPGIGFIKYSGKYVETIEFLGVEGDFWKYKATLTDMESDNYVYGIAINEEERREVINEAKQILAVLKLNQDVDEPVRMQIIGNRNKSKMLNVSPDAIKKIAKIMRNESINESDLGLTYKKGKTVKVTHKKSGKELIIIDKPNVKREYEKIGYFAEGKVNELSMAPFSSPEARSHINSDIKDMSRHLGKASQQVIKIMMSGVKSGKYTAMDISRGIKEGPAKRTHFGEMTFIQSLWTKMREKFRKYSKDRKLS